MNRFQFSSGQVAAVALGLWVSSLFFDAYVPYRDAKDAYSGMGLLLSGWLGLLGVSVAWLANPLFLVALARRRSDGAVYAVAAALVALHSFMVDAIPTGDGGSTHIYGYGLALVLWLMAMGVGLIATSMGDALGGVWVRGLGLLWLTAVPVAFGAFATKDRIQANKIERQRLHSVLIKRGPVCKSEGPTAERLEPPAVVVEFPPREQAGYPFDSPYGLLSWGIPVVRVNGYDYTRVVSGADRFIRISRSEGAAAAKLEYLSKDSERRVRLISADGKVLLDQTWMKIGPEYCPDYHEIIARPDDQPRKVVIEALGLSSEAARPPEPDFWKTVPRLTGRVVAREPAGDAPWPGNNPGCPAQLGVDYDRARASRIEGRPFFWGSAAYQFYHPAAFSVCSDRHVYLYDASKSSGNYFLTVTKRSVPDLQLAWSAQVKVVEADPALDDHNTRILSVSEADGVLRIKTRHYGHDRILTIEVPFGEAVPGGQAKVN